MLFKKLVAICSQFAGLAFILLIASTVFGLAAAFAADQTTQFVCVNKNSGAIVTRGKCKKSKEIRLSEKSYSQGKAQILYVAPSGAKYTDIPSALEAAQALNPSSTQPVLIKVAPGTYSLDSSLLMVDNVSLQGSGIDITKISSSANTVVSLGSDLTISDLTITSTNSSSALIISADGSSSAYLNNLKIVYTGTASSVSAVSVSNSALSLDNLRLDLTGQAGSFIIGLALTSGTIDANRINSTLTDGDVHSVQINSASVKLTDSEFISSTSTGTDQSLAIRVLNASGTLFADGVKVKSSETANGVAEALQVFDATNVIVKNSYFEQIGFANAAVYADGAGKLKLYNSVVITESSNPTVATFDTGIVSVFGSQLSGGAASASGGALTCAGVTDENFTFSASSCP